MFGSLRIRFCIPERAFAVKGLLANLFAHVPPQSLIGILLYGLG